MIKQNKKILIIRCGLLGDTVDATSVVDPLLEHYGNEVDIHWVTKPGISKLFSEDPRIIKTFELKHTKLPLLLNKDKLKILIESLRNPYDLILNLEIGKKFNDVVRFTRAQYKIGMPYEYIKDDIFKEHRVKHQLRILNKFINNYNEQKAIPSIVGCDADALKKKFSINNQYIVLCPTNSHIDNENHRGYRSWPKDKWIDLIKIILRETNLDIYLAGSSNEQNYFREFHPLDKRVKDISGLTTIPELISMMKNAHYVVATDSGSAHVAGAVCKNVVCIHGPTNHYQSSPYQTYKNNVKVATLGLECSPCYDTDIIKKCQKNICMHDLSADLVFNLINEF